jgi:hypothetical protein
LLALTPTRSDHERRFAELLAQAGPEPAARPTQTEAECLTELMAGLRQRELAEASAAPAVVAADPDAPGLTHGDAAAPPADAVPADAREAAGGDAALSPDDPHVAVLADRIGGAITKLLPDNPRLRKPGSLTPAAAAELARLVGLPSDDPGLSLRRYEAAVAMIAAQAAPEPRRKPEPERRALVAASPSALASTALAAPAMPSAGPTGPITGAALIAAGATLVFKRMPKAWKALRGPYERHAYKKDLTKSERAALDVLLAKYSTTRHGIFAKQKTVAAAARGLGEEEYPAGQGPLSRAQAGLNRKGVIHVLPRFWRGQNYIRFQAPAAIFAEATLDQALADGIVAVAGGELDAETSEHARQVEKRAKPRAEKKRAREAARYAQKRAEKELPYRPRKGAAAGGSAYLPGGQSAYLPTPGEVGRYATSGISAQALSAHPENPENSSYSSTCEPGRNAEPASHKEKSESKLTLGESASLTLSLGTPIAGVAADAATLGSGVREEVIPPAEGESTPPAADRSLPREPQAHATGEFEVERPALDSPNTAGSARLLPVGGAFPGSRPGADAPGPAPGGMRDSASTINLPLVPRAFLPPIPAAKAADMLPLLLRFVGELGPRLQDAMRFYRYQDERELPAIGYKVDRGFYDETSKMQNLRYIAEVLSELLSDLNPEDQHRVFYTIFPDRREKLWYNPPPSPFGPSLTPGVVF